MSNCTKWFALSWGAVVVASLFSPYKEAVVILGIAAMIAFKEQCK
ncbi:MAG: hypothetical protein WA144_15480 [Candidatus Methanoperedens sp.]